VNDDGLRSVIVAQHIVHDHIVVQVWIRFCERYAIVGSLCSRPVDVDGSFLARIEVGFLLQANSQRLVVAFKEFARTIVSTYLMLLHTDSLDPVRIAKEARRGLQACGHYLRQYWTLSA